jgi:type II secretory pathway component GspD/PulD (secretin)
MTMTPSVTDKATILDVNICNSSLIGYTSDGAPRIQQGAVINTSFMIDNKGTKLMIGGLEKRDVVRVSGGIPILKDLPVIGWLFSTESESTKRSQLLVVAEIMPLTTPAEVTKRMPVIKSELDKAGESNRYGFRQYLLDPAR